MPIRTIKVELRFEEYVIQVDKFLYYLCQRASRDKIDHTHLTAKTLLDPSDQETPLVGKPFPHIRAWPCLKHGYKHLRYLIAHGKVDKSTVSSGSFLVKSDDTPGLDLEPCLSDLPTDLIQVDGCVLVFLRKLEAVFVRGFYAKENLKKPALAIMLINSGWAARLTEA